MTATQTSYRPKWLSDEKRDRQVTGITRTYIVGLKKAAREVADELYKERGGKNILYIKLRDAYLDIEDKSEL